MFVLRFDDDQEAIYSESFLELMQYAITCSERICEEEEHPEAGWVWHADFGQGIGRICWWYVDSELEWGAIEHVRAPGENEWGNEWPNAMRQGALGYEPIPHEPNGVELFEWGAMFAELFDWNWGLEGEEILPGHPSYCTACGGQCVVP